MRILPLLLLAISTGFTPLPPIGQRTENEVPPPVTPISQQTEHEAPPVVTPTSQSTESEAPPPVTIVKHPRASLSECGLSPDGELGPLDVAIAIDASRSTVDPSGSDVDADGDIGKPFLGRIGKIYDVGSTDPEDSWLYAEVRAARAVVDELAGGDVRFSIVAFSGITPHATEPKRTQHAVIEAALTGDSDELEAALDRVLEKGSLGTTRFSSGMDLANQTLTQEPGARRGRRVVLFVSENPNPTAPRVGRAILDPAMKDAALAAVDSGIVYYTFGLGDAADAPTSSALNRIGKGTGGRFYAVQDPMLLHCEMARSILPPAPAQGGLQPTPRRPAP